MAKTFILSDESLNNYGFRIITAGIQLEQFKKNPVMYFMHRRPNRFDEKVEEKLPIGIWENIRVDGNKLVADANFDLSDPFAKKIADKVEKGFLRMASLGASVEEASSDLSLLVPGQIRETITKCIAQEASIVDIGGNNNAFALSNDCGCALYFDGNIINLSNSSENTIKLLNTNQPKKDMKKIALALGLSEDASEENIIAAIIANKTAVETAKIQLAKIQDDRIKEVVSKGIAERKFTDADKDKYIQLCKTDIELGTNIINSMPSQKTPSNVITPGAGTTPEDKPKKFTELSLAEVEDLRSNHKAKYVELYKAEYGKEPNLID